MSREHKYRAMRKKIKEDVSNMLGVYQDDPDPKVINLYTGFIMDTVEEHQLNKTGWFSLGLMLGLALGFLLALIPALT